MKLIIDIDKEQYEPIKEHKGGFYIGIFNNIRNGIPFEEELEKVKAEIENMWIKSAKDLKTGKVIYENLCEHSEVLEIINKHISELKGEQE